VLRPRFPAAFRPPGIRLIGTLSCQGVQPPLRSAYRTACAYPRLRCGPIAGFPRSARVRPGPGRAPSIPRGRRCPPAGGDLRPSPATSQRRSLSPRNSHPARGAAVTRHQRGFPGSRPSGPSPHLWPPWLGQRPLGFPVSFAPSQPGAGHARHGGDRSGTTWSYVPGISQTSSTRSLTTCDLVSQSPPATAPRRSRSPRENGRSTACHGAGTGA